MHEQFMLAALKQAWLGRGQCAPNPAVGAVAVRDQSIVAQAFHSGAGSLHAERKLLKQLPDDCRNITLYVTLEPCNHWGKTPPCVDALIERQIKKVVYGHADPNPIVSQNNTPDRLRAHGIEVEFYPMSEVTHFYRSYDHWTKTKRPWVTVKIAQTLDGKIAGPHGRTIMLSNQACAEFTHLNRLHTDVILTTATTINQDNPALNVRQNNQVIASKPVAILDRTAKLDTHAQIYTTAERCLIYQKVHIATGAITPTCRPHDLFAGLSTAPMDHAPRDVSFAANRQHALDACETYQIPEHATGLDLEAVFSHLGSLGFHDVWVEAGARLFHALHVAGLVHTTHVYLVPKVLGPDALSLYTAYDVFQAAPQILWQSLGDNMLATFEWNWDSYQDQL